MALFDSVTNVHPAMVQVMYSRGLGDADLCADFLAGVCRDPDDPHLLKDVDRAVERLVQAQRNQEQVAVFTDYDADGVWRPLQAQIFRHRSLGRPAPQAPVRASFRKPQVGETGRLARAQPFVTRRNVGVDLFQPIHIHQSSAMAIITDRSRSASNVSAATFSRNVTVR